MRESNKFFFPIPYSTLEATATLSDGELGAILRELLRSGGEADYKPKLNGKLATVYGFMLCDAVRIFNLKLDRRRDGAKAQPKSAASTPAKRRLGDFDPNEAFENALARSYGK